MRYTWKQATDDCQLPKAILVDKRTNIGHGTWITHSDLPKAVNESNKSVPEQQRTLHLHHHPRSDADLTVSTKMEWWDEKSFQNLWLKTIQKEHSSWMRTKDTWRGNSQEGTQSRITFTRSVQFQMILVAFLDRHWKTYRNLGLRYKTRKKQSFGVFEDDVRDDLSQEPAQGHWGSENLLVWILSSVPCQKISDPGLWKSCNKGRRPGSFSSDH